MDRFRAADLEETLKSALIGPKPDPVLSMWLLDLKCALAQQPYLRTKSLKYNGAGCRNRTRDLRFTKPLLYHLS